MSKEQSIIEGYARALDIKYFGKKRKETARFGIDSVYSKTGATELSYPGCDPFVKVRLILEVFPPPTKISQRPRR